MPPDAAAFATLNPVTPLTASSFATPPQNDMPWARWNFPPATATIDGLMTDMQDAYDHHIGGLEIGQGGVPTSDQLVAIYDKANALGMTISLKVASALPVGSYSNSDPYARRTLQDSATVVNAGATFNGAVTGSATGTIVAVEAYRCTAASCPTSGTIDLDRSSAIDLTATLTGTNASGYDGGSTAGTLNWTAPASPAGAQWELIAFRAIPYGSTPETLSPQGTKELTDAYDSYLSGALGPLVKANHGDFFVDSHASDPWGVPEELWSSNMRSEFQSRAGYDIVPNLPALFDSSMGSSSPYFSFSDGSAGRVRSDFNRVRSTLYSQNRLTAFERWARTYGMKLRLQQEDIASSSQGDQIETSLALDRSEHESLIGSDQTDTYRPMASTNHMNGNTWFSSECCASLNESYVQTVQDVTIRMNHEFAGGINRPVFHIRPYIDTPASSWPGLGFSTAKVSFSNAWNRSEPYWVDQQQTDDYFARSHEVLTQGAAKEDVAVYQRTYSAPAAFGTTDPSNKHWQDTGLQRAGYTWDYLDEPLMRLPNAVVTNRRLAQDGPDYKALIFDQFLQPSTNTARGTLTLEAAQDILGYAKAGLPVIFVGTPVGTGGLPASDDAQLSSLVAQILAQPSVSQVASEADVPAKLAALGIAPAAKPAAPTSLLSVRRYDPGTKTNYYWLWNQGVDAYPGNTGTFGYNPSNLYEEPSACRYTASAGINPCMATGAAVSTDVTLAGAGVPYALDAFTGTITPIAQYSRSGDTVSVHVSLGRDATTVIALSDDPQRLGLSRPSTSVSSTTADGASQTGDTISVRATAAGTYTTTLADGRTVSTTLPAAPAAIDLTAATWHLDAQDWQPQNRYGTLGPAGTLTDKVPVSLDLSGLKPWPDIPQLASASGIGTYSTTVDLPAGWNASYGATLSLGQVTDTFTLTINGQAVGINAVDPTVDVGPYLHAGANSIVVRVATTLDNRLYALDTAVRNRGVIQNYGLVGPVVLTPYRQAAVYSSTSAGGSVGGSVPATLALTLGAPATFGSFLPGVERDYDASTTATVSSTAGDATLTVADPSTTASGHLVNGAFSLPAPLLAAGAPLPAVVKTYGGPVSNDVATIAFRQHVGAGDALRTGSYGKTLTFTLSTTTP